MPEIIPPSVRNWLIAQYLADPTPRRAQLSDDSVPEPIVLVRFDEFAAFLVTAGVELLPSLNAWKKAGWIEDVMVDIALTDDPNDTLPECVARLNLQVGHHRLVGIRRGILDSARPRIKRFPEGIAQFELPDGRKFEGHGVLFDEGTCSYMVFGQYPPYSPANRPSGDNPYTLMRFALSELQSIALLDFLGIPTESIHSNRLVAMCHEANKQARRNRISHGISDQTCDAVLADAMNLMMVIGSRGSNYDPLGGDYYNSVTHRLGDLALLADARLEPNGSDNNNPPIAVVGDDPFAALRQLARKMSKQERLVLEAICRAEGELPLADVKALCEWQDPIESAWNSLRSRLNTKLESHGWKVKTQASVAHLTKPDTE